MSVSLTSSLLAADRLWAPAPLSPADADRFVLEQSRISALLDPRVDLDALDSPDGHRRLRAGAVRLPLLDEGELPHDVASLDAVLRRFRGELAVGRQGRDAVRFLRLPPIPPVALPGYASLFAGALGSLAAEERRQLGLPLPAPVAAAGVHQCGVTLTAMRTAVGVSPAIELATSRIRAAA